MPCTIARAKCTLSPILMMKNVFLVFLSLLSMLLPAQQPQSGHFVWGAGVGFETQLTGIQPIDLAEPDQMRVESRRHAFGGSLTVFGRWQFWRGLSIQPALSLADLQSELYFNRDGVKKYRFTDLEIPLHLVLTNSSGHFPLRGTVLLGGRLGWNFAGQPSEYLSLLRERLALDAGLGVEIRWGPWRLQPEIVYSHGMNNMHDVTNAQYDWVVGRVVRDRLTFRMLVWLDKTSGE